MSINSIESNFVRQYADTFTVLCEQKESRLLGSITNNGEVTGDSFTTIELGEVGEGKAIKRGDATQYNDSEYASRLALMADSANFTRVAIQDLKKLKANPTDQLLKRLVSARNRKVDAVIYAALTGVAQRKVVGGDVYTNVALPAAQTLGTDTTPISKQLLIDVRTKFLANEVPEDETIYITYNAEMLNAILADTTLTSADYLAGQMLQRGEVSNFLGFNWVHYEGIAKAGKGLGVAYTSEACVFGSQVHSPLKIAELEGNNRMQSIGHIDGFGAVRADEKRVVAFKFKS